MTTFCFESANAFIPWQCAAHAAAILAEIHELAVGARMGSYGDAVVSPEVATLRADTGEIDAANIPREGAVIPGADCSDGEVLRHGGYRLRAIDLPIIQAVGVAGVGVHKPSVRIAARRRRSRRCCSRPAVQAFLVALATSDVREGMKFELGS